MQKAIIVRGTKISELNDLLSQGYKVVSTCPMPSSCTTAVSGDMYNYRDISIDPQCLVILEK